METIMIIQYSTPVILTGLVVSNARLSTMVSQLRDDVKSMQAGTVWNKECKAHRTSIEGRVDRLESQSNGKGGQ